MGVRWGASRSVPCPTNTMTGQRSWNTDEAGGAEPSIRERLHGHPTVTDRYPVLKVEPKAYRSAS